jgi:hypothetical protein
MRRLSRVLCIAVSVLLLLAASAQGQVDWSNLLGEQDAPPAADVPQHPDAPAAAVQAPAPHQAEVRETPTRASRRARSKPGGRAKSKLHSRRQTGHHVETDDEPEYPSVPAQRRRP